MKSLLGKLGVILVIGLTIFGYAEVWGAEWKFYGSSEKVFYYYDTQSITHPSKDIVRVWERWDYTEKGVLDKVGKFGKEYENLSHTIFLWEINCSEKKDRGLSLTHYDHKGSAIHSIRSPSEWSFITPESIGEIMYKEVCK
jgi:hypothetical protein